MCLKWVPRKDGNTKWDRSSTEVIDGVKVIYYKLPLHVIYFVFRRNLADQTTRPWTICFPEYFLNMPGLQILGKSKDSRNCLSTHHTAFSFALCTWRALSGCCIPGTSVRNSVEDPANSFIRLYIFSLRKFGLYLWAATEKRDQYMKMSSTHLILLCVVWRAHIRTPKLSQQFSCRFFNYLNMLLKNILTGSQLFCRTVSQKTAWKTAGRWKNLSSPATGAQHCASLTPASHCARRDCSAIACDVWSLTGATSTC